MGTVHRTHAVHLTLRALATAGLLAGCGSAPPAVVGPELRLTPPPPLPDTTGFGVHVLAVRRAPDGGFWVGTHGEGLFVMPSRSNEWRHVPATDASDSPVWASVNSIAFETDSAVIWYGTVGDGFGRSPDGGRSWRSWTANETGPAWQYVTPGGIVVRRDTVYVATTGGLRITGDDGASWRCIRATSAPAPAAGAADGCAERIGSLSNPYLLSLAVTTDGVIFAGHLQGVAVSRDGGRSWFDVDVQGMAGRRVRALLFAPDSSVWAATESAIYVDSAADGRFREADVRVPGYARLPGAPRALGGSPGLLPPIVATTYGLVGRTTEGGYRLFFVGAADQYRPAGDLWSATWWGPPFQPVGGSTAGLARTLAGNLPTTGIFDPAPPAQPAAAQHAWFQRPIADADGNPHIDQTRRYGATLLGRFGVQPGVTFHNPAGTPIRAIGDGVVVQAGPGAAGAPAVVIRHDRQWEGQYVFSAYHHGADLQVTAGQRVQAGAVIGRVGRADRGLSSRLQLEVHLAPTQDAAVADPAGQFPAHAVNPQLWLQPLPGTGIVAGRVLDAAGQPLSDARVHGLVVAYPTETPFSFAETYAAGARATPAYGEHFAIGDVQPGLYNAGVRIAGRIVWRRIRVAADSMTWVEFRP